MGQNNKIRSGHKNPGADHARHYNLHDQERHSTA